jgi:hypothetical protein
MQIFPVILQPFYANIQVVMRITIQFNSFLFFHKQVNGQYNEKKITLMEKRAFAELVSNSLKLS